MKFLCQKSKQFLTSMLVENGGPINTKNYLNDVRRGILLTGVKCHTDVTLLQVDELKVLVSPHKYPHRARKAINALVSACGCTALIIPQQTQSAYSKAEKAWLSQQSLHRADFYVRERSHLLCELKKRRGYLAQSTLCDISSKMFRILMCVHPSDKDNINAGHFVEYVTALVVQSTQQNSVLMHRGSRRKVPYRLSEQQDMIAKFMDAANFIMNVWDIRQTQPTHKSSHRMVARQVTQKLDSMQKHKEGFRPILDRLTMQEMDDSTQGAHQKPRLQLMLFLMSRLAMRVGALLNLRLVALVHGFDDPEALKYDAQWKVRSFIRSWDKCYQMNEWSTVHVRHQLETYINTIWRPQHEIWVSNTNDGKIVLKNGYLFPARAGKSHTEKHMCTSTVCQEVRSHLLQMGIDSGRAHCHAFRKGVITHLLKIGNQIDRVARFAHHRSALTTERSYDNRTDDEVVNSLIIPHQWSDSNTKNNNPSIPEHIDDSQCTEVQLELATDTVIQLTEERNTLQKRLHDAMSMLTDEQKYQLS